ncbi:ABC-type transporter, permease component [Corynebacterium kutscheri]|uniref:ABC-type enterobactin transport system, permease component n=1 Tax=Corynebacterium kutscheri TaxID=35755 RepID=A0A0F6R243_9CORY|nr:iron ABC transporter permease [Corynebacterium kutscheri]AKE42255.1 ABC-type enterobactin transport system, permease component [Corynebacterium kutscheri]VEH05667.1 ABC-type transporter, permease component [Corynebacterium kutscheri]VEH10598.1 ABC-type transporter, permease component [Corynebacterium kutscheri]VEH81562.1 ABC-type transporter, permease component [Corynebacterium kutscheri]
MTDSSSLAVEPSISAHALRRQRTLARTKAITGITVLLILLVVLIAVALMYGETFYPLSDVFAVIQGRTVPGASYTVGELRLPRTIIGVCVGLALGASGVSFQIMLRNQLASPDIVGISATASTVGVIGITVFHLNSWLISLLSLVFTLLVAIAMYTFTKGGTKLILIGIGVGAFMQSIVVFVLSKANESDLQSAGRWMAGSLNQSNWKLVLPVVVLVLILLPLLICLSHHLSVLRLGDELAAGLGLSVDRSRKTVMALSVFLTAVSTAAVGPIAFVAFMSGPIALRIPHRNLILTASLIGALLVLVSDLISQLLLPYRYPVGVVTGVLGAPFLIYLLIRSNKKGASL